MKKIIIHVIFFQCLILAGQERFSIIDGQKFRISESGSRDITVIFESGMSDSLETWGSIPDSVALFAHVFRYDRADIGKSDPSRQERSIPNMVQELKSILHQEKIEPPYILVGHSLGGYLTRYFSGQYPGEVTGLLLLDPAPETYWQKMSKKELKEYIDGGTHWYETRFKPGYRKEWFRFIPNMEYMHDLKIRKELPVILVSATESNWYRFHKKIIKGLKNARHTELPGTHHIYKDHPGLIVDYIRELCTLQQKSPVNPAR